MGTLFALLLLAAFVPATVSFHRWRRSALPGARFGRLPHQFVRWVILGAGVALILILLAIAAPIYVENEWFKHLGFGSVFLTRGLTELGLFAVFALLAGAVPFLALRVPFHALPRSNAALPVPWKLGYPALRVARHVVTIAVAVFVGLYAMEAWQQTLLSFHGEDMSEADPIFDKDVGFYLFRLPFYAWALSVLQGVLIASLVLTGVAWVFLNRMVEMVHGKAEPVHYLLRVLRGSAVAVVVPLLLVQAGRLYLARYDLMCSTRGRVHGVSYVDHHVTLPLYWLYMAGCLVLATAILWVALRPSARGGWRLLLGSVGGLVLCWIVGSGIVSWGVQSWVHSNELDLEKPYIANGITATRKAYGIDIDPGDVRDYYPNDRLTYEELKKDPESLNNIRLWDWEALKSTYQETQGMKPYYAFPDIDIDRYTINGRVRQVMLASREIDISKLPKESQTWNNHHLVYTHGYGVCLNQATEFTPEGMPRMHIKDIPPVSDVVELWVKRPEIYFGELTRHHVYVGTTADEFSYPGDNGNVFHRYEGRAGVRVGWGLRRLALAWCFDGFQQLLSRYITADSRLIWHREIHDRIRTIAPFLRLDGDTYKVIRDDGRLCYMQDAYTWSSTYPYSTPQGKGDLNYIRASVKVSIDAYDGDVTFWVFDENDPVLRAWGRAFPGLFRSRSEMPDDLRRHVRYPEDLFRIQALMLADYHMEAQDFYMREDRWQIARDLFKTGNQEVDPYYALLKLPGEKSTEFVLMLPFTPFERHNLVTWLGGRCDGENYGRLLIYKMPHHSLVWGPMQIDTKIDQEPEMSSQLTLWKQKGSEVIRGTLLVVPIQGGLLYVEPIYLKAEKIGMPALRKVVAGYGERVAWGENFDLALRRLFGKEPTSPITPPGPPVAETPTQLKAASAELDRYFELMGQGKPAEAGKVLEDLRKMLRGEPK
jgi:uncharacterized membrane protein (UPF0182 family)